MGRKIDVAFIFKILSVFTLAAIVNCISLSDKVNYSDNINTLNLNVVFTISDKPLRISPVKKWQVGRVSRKHYEIVNMLWRKTKIFVDIESTTPTGPRPRRNNQNFKPLTTAGRPILHTSTASFIEFYYLDDSDERVKRRETFIPAFENSRRRQQFSDDNIFLQSPILSMRTNNRVPKGLTKVPKTTVNSQLGKQSVDKNPSVYGYLSSRFKIGLLPKPKADKNVSMIIIDNTIPTVKLDSETCPATTLEPEYFVNASSSSRTPFNTNAHSEMFLENKDIKTTADDKIKFFEIYDKHTMRPGQEIDKIMLYADETYNMVKENYNDANQKIDLEDVDQILPHHDGNKVKNVKKHIDQSAIPMIIRNLNEGKPEQKLKFKTVMFNVNKTAAELRNESQKISKNSSRVALWSDYPFAAVYVYEPSQIHCDAAALSPHWLVAAGSCLSRFHDNDPVSEGRSAFVTYCGQNWWKPERVSYVKYSIVHPRFHPKDDARRFIYNIGLIQVVTSMSSCSGWAPLSLMSHNFAADSDGSIGTAVGWGLDRYDVRYSSVMLPKLPLSAFNGFVYSESCPGSSTYRKGKFSNEESTLKSLYCLSLPPYSGEQNDPVHGSLLLVGGKLIALYLQEERRVWGEQSAQYTGVWRLVPWVHEVAREQDEADSFTIDF